MFKLLEEIAALSDKAASWAILRGVAAAQAVAAASPHCERDRRRKVSLAKLCPSDMSSRSPPCDLSSYDILLVPPLSILWLPL